MGSPASRQDAAWTVGVTALAFAVYLLTLAPSITFENMGSDSGDLVATARALGVPHPPGYPTYALLARLAIQLPIGSIAYRVHLLSACCAALTVGLVFDSARRLAAPRPGDVLVESHLREALVRLNPEIAEQPERANRADWVDEVIYRLRAIQLTVGSEGWCGPTSISQPGGY